MAQTGDFCCVVVHFWAKHNHKTKPTTKYQKGHISQQPFQPNTLSACKTKMKAALPTWSNILPERFWKQQTTFFTVLVHKILGACTIFTTRDLYKETRKAQKTTKMVV